MPGIGALTLSVESNTTYVYSPNEVGVPPVAEISIVAEHWFTDNANKGGSSTVKVTVDEHLLNPFVMFLDTHTQFLK